MRTTHDRQYDHHSRDIDSNLELEFDIAHYPAGSILQSVLASMADRIAALELAGNIYAIEARAVLLKGQASSFTADAVLG